MTNLGAKKIEFGDFQTPDNLAEDVAMFLKTQRKVNPAVIVEPTCGVGSFVTASLKAFPSLAKVFAYDINSDHLAALKRRLNTVPQCDVKVSAQNFFSYDWRAFLQKQPDGVLIIGNPPWVTNTAIGAIGGKNLPQKNNFQNHPGFLAMTGKANFDISEWMLIRLIESLKTKKASIAMLCKTATARKVLKHSWNNDFSILEAALYLIDAGSSFDVSVDACLFVVNTGAEAGPKTATIYSDLYSPKKITTFGLMGREFVSDTDSYAALKDLDGRSYYKWRSGVKHDASSVMELTRNATSFVNRQGEPVEIEETYVYPMLKSSDLANRRLKPERYVLITQKLPNSPTNQIEQLAPRTWKYLCKNAKALSNRKSSIYKKRAQFSIFGVGDYTFAPWKVAISALYKDFHFEVLGMSGRKPIVLDDTCNFIPCKSRDEALFVCELLNSQLATRFLNSLVFLDNKRPITIDILNRLDIFRLAQRLGLSNKAKMFLCDASAFEDRQPLLVCDKKPRYKVNKNKKARHVTLAH